MKLLLVYPPFCPPTVPPHSITYLAAALKPVSPGVEIKCIDLNAKFHRARFPKLYARLPKARKSTNAYSGLLEKYLSSSRPVHRQNNLDMSTGSDPEFFEEMLALLSDESPSVVGFSVVYNSQLFYAHRLIQALERTGVRCIAGGPAAARLAREAVTVLADENELSAHIGFADRVVGPYAPDFGCYDPADYLAAEMVHPLRSSYGCSWGACAFCTHHSCVAHRDIPIREIASAILANRSKNVFFIDDNIPRDRLEALARALGPLGVRWSCQTRPTRDLLGLFPALRAGGCVSISFGVESGSQSMLDAMRKGTVVGEVAQALAESHEAGIKNLAFIMFGFPGETRETFLETMEFLRLNQENIDIVSASVFGLQKGSHVYRHPELYGIIDIRSRDTPLGETVSYSVGSGLGERGTHAIKERFNPELRAMNKLPKAVAVLKEQSLFF